MNGPHNGSTTESILKTEMTAASFHNWDTKPIYNYVKNTDSEKAIHQLPYVKEDK